MRPTDWLIGSIAVLAALSSAAVAEAQGANPASVFPGDIPALSDVAGTAGLDHGYTGDWEFFVGGGVASFDCNGDRRPDVVLAGGTSPAALYVNRSSAGGELAFEAQDILASGKAIKGVTGAYPINLNNDAHTDLVLLRLGSNRLLLGEGDCRFSDANKRLGFDGGRAWTTAFAATWEPGEAFPTLAFGNYVDRRAPGSPFGTCEDNVLIRPGAGGSDQPDYSAPIPLSPSHCTLSLLFTDWEGEGQFDLRVTNDRQYHRGGQEQLWQIPPQGQPREFTSADGWEELVIWGMGIAQADLDADGRPEYALTSMGDTKVQRLSEDAYSAEPIYEDIAFDRGLTAHRPYTGDSSRPSTGWHAQFADINNDTWSDLYIAKGNVQAMPNFAAFDPDNLLLGTPSGQFEETGDAAGIAQDTRGRGAVIEDFNADGQLDLLVVNREAQPGLFRNLGPVGASTATQRLGNFLRVELDNGAVNPDAIGAMVSVKTGNRYQTQTVAIGGGHASGQLGFVHFGLGLADLAEVRVKWPDSGWSAPYQVYANSHVVISRDETNVLLWYPVD